MLTPYPEQNGLRYLASCSWVTELKKPQQQKIFHRSRQKIGICNLPSAAMELVALLMIIG
jgi:hypothetical protein